VDLSAFSLSGKIALATGAARGIGRALALGLARAGALVVVIDLDGEGAARGAGEIRTAGRRLAARPGRHGRATRLHGEQGRARQPDPDPRARVGEATPLGAFPPPETIVGAVVYLASPAAEFVTGSILVVDGGYIAR
jgi:NAD(P)-dependent dehydrogenase (short-subunit alcohol dehydrogenase family)